MPNFQVPKYLEIRHDPCFLLPIVPIFNMLDNIKGCSIVNISDTYDA